MEHSGMCKKCGHLMADHGVDYWYKSYCANGNDGDCKCDVAGQSYEEALQEKIK
jgi:hypothetical protein